MRKKVLYICRSRKPSVFVKTGGRKARIPEKFRIIVHDHWLRSQNDLGLKSCLSVF